MRVEPDGPIESFTGAYRFLSNFWPVPIGPYRTVEHAYQASKTLDSREVLMITNAPTAGKAKALGSRVRLRENWDDIKLAVMYALLIEKFDDGSALADLLVETAPRVLIEGNTWGDQFWGVCYGRGENWLGRLLMLRRSELAGRNGTLA
jgi:ribA/ribD-fused uncharacterized protein